MPREIDDNPFIKSSCKRDLELEELFESTNAKYFAGNLKKFKVYVCTKAKNFGHMSAGWCSTSEGKIFLRSNLSKNSSAYSLLHEMVHAKLSNNTENHGKLFVKELKRIRKLGAPLSPADIDVAKGYYEPPKLSKIILEKFIREAIFTEELPERSVAKY